MLRRSVRQMKMKMTLTILLSLICVACSRQSRETDSTVLVVGTQRFTCTGDEQGVKSLHSDLQKYYQRYGEYSVAIQPSPSTTHLSVRTMIDICSAIGFWPITLTDDAGAPLRFTRLWAFDPSEDRMWIPTNSVRVDVTSGGFPSSEIADITSNSPVLITCTPDSVHRDLVAVMKSCEAVGNTNVYIISIAGRRTAEPEN
jgi:hypothetical protein